MRKATHIKVLNWLMNTWELVKENVLMLGFREAEIILPKNDATLDKNSDSLDSYCDALINNDKLLKLFNSDSDSSSFDGFE